MNHTLVNRHSFILVVVALLIPSATSFSSETGSSNSTPKPGDTINEPLVDMDFIYIKPGTFMMGSPETETNRYDDERQHRVTIERGFWMGKFEVTFTQYDKFSNVSNYVKANDNRWGRGERPVIKIRWFDATTFAKWLSKQTGHYYRLPTEAEWEYAARAGTTTAFSFGDDESEFHNYAWNGESANRQTHPVGLKKPNPWGLHDMHGNVWEWTSSAYAENYDGSELKPSNFELKTQHAVVRGGAWYFFPKGLRSADRRLYAPWFRLAYIGFRLVREE